MPLRVRVVLGPVTDVQADVVILPAKHTFDDGHVIHVQAPRWQFPDGPDRLLAAAYREALSLANEHRARSLALPAILARGPWPLEHATRVALDVLSTTPTSVHHVWIAARTPAMLERWAEALVAWSPPDTWWMRPDKRWG
jgi:O-acetyl-ADP-ribose deacetylase